MRDRCRLGLAALTLAGWPPAGVQADEPAIIPRPVLVADRPGPPVRFANGTPVLVEHAATRAGAARSLVAMMRRAGGPRLVLAARGHAAVAIRFRYRSGFAPEGYALDIAANGATVTASSAAGSYYGAVSLGQLLAAAPDGRIAPRHIEDAPRFAWRGVVLDSARHIQSPAAIARMLDWMALHKLNRLQWHLADDQGWRLPIAGYPRLTSIGAWRPAGTGKGRYGGFYTHAQVRHIVALAAARHITVVPEIEMPGHATAAILAYPDIGLTTATRANLGDWGVFPSIYNVDGPGVAFLHHVLDQVMALFPSPEIAIGGDEAVHRLWLGSPTAMARMQALGLKDGPALQAWFIGRISAYLRAHGRRLVGWDEILADNGLPAEAIVLSWHGADGAIAAARAGHDVVMATAPTLYFDNRQSTAPSEPPGRGFVVSLADVYGYDPGNPPHLPGTAPLDAASLPHVLGVQAALWSEHIASDAALEAMALPRAAALAEIGWTPGERRDWPSFVARLPAMIGLYRALGLRADDGAFAVQAKVAPHGDQATVALTRQLAVGDIRYTIDGTAPNLSSPRYQGAFAMPLPAHLRAASFAGVQQLSRDLDLPLSAISITRRTSQQLEQCTGKISLNLAGPRMAYLVDIKNPCWIDRGADLTGILHIAVSVAALPFNFQLANEPALTLPKTAFPTGELIIRQGCGGPTLATIPLPAALDAMPHELIADIAPLSGAQDLCLTLARPKLDPLWALGWLELRP